jgi:hypothetical protein
MTALFLPHGELVAQAWLRGIEGVPTNGVGTTLPKDNSTWAASGFVQISVAGGTPDPYNPISNPVIGVDCYACTMNGSQPPWGKANQLVEIIKLSGYGTVDSLNPAHRVVALAPQYQNARVQTAYAITEPKRMPSDEARFARYHLDMQFSYVPTTLPGFIGPISVPDPSDGAGGFVHYQTIPAPQWILNHNLGHEAHVTVWDDTGEVVFPEIDNPSLNTTVIIFASPQTGTAIIG